MEKFSELENGQLAYRDMDGNLMILPMDNRDVRSAFIRRLITDYVENRKLDELLTRFAESAEDVEKGRTKNIEDLNKEGMLGEK